jgi:hypothetical protein
LALATPTERTTKKPLSRRSRDGPVPGGISRPTSQRTGANTIAVIAVSITVDT